jgi:hypothetical protein
MKKIFFRHRRERICHFYIYSDVKYAQFILSRSQIKSIMVRRRFFAIVANGEMLSPE